MSDLKFIEGPLNSEQLQSLMICAKLGHSTTPAVLVALLDQLDAQRLRADTAEAALKIAAEDVALMLKDLDAVEQRIAEQAELLREASRYIPGHGPGSVTGELLIPISAALNPNPEAESHE